MEFITTTDLRTKSSALITSLKNGESISLIHRSKVVGIIKPKKEPKPLTKKDITTLQQVAKELNLSKISYKERDRI